MSWKEEDEYIDEESNTGFGEKKSSDGFPVPSVAQRIVAYAERTGKNIEEVKQMYTDYIKKNTVLKIGLKRMKTCLQIGLNKPSYKQENKQQAHREHLHG